MQQQQEQRRSMGINANLSKKRRWILLILIIVAILFVIGMVLLVLGSVYPCLFIRCHSKATQCINRSAFKGQCVCDDDMVGNGRTVCDECGIKYDPPSARIIGGSDAIENSWPFAVFIRQYYKTNLQLNNESLTISTSWICGGTLINHKTVLTAAHCLKSEGDTFDFQSMTFPIVWNEFYSNVESTLEVSVGLHDRRKQAERRHVTVMEVIRHPSFEDRSLLNDIALLKLHDYLRPSSTIQFACLTHSPPDVNQSGIVVGFGDTSPGANRGSMILQQVNLTVYPDEFCSNVSPWTKKNWQIQLCSGDLQGQRDTCQGDSGGGLYIKRNLSSIIRYTIDGIVSYGEQCASPMKPGIYTRVSAYLDWIREHSDFVFY